MSCWFNSFAVRVGGGHAYFSAVLIELTDEERAVLEGWTRHRSSAQALALRARIVLMASEGLWANGEIAEALDVARLTVTKWRKQVGTRNVSIQCTFDGRRRGSSLFRRVLAAARAKRARQLAHTIRISQAVAVVRAVAAAPPRRPADQSPRA